LQYSFNHAQGYQLFLFLYFSNFFPKVGYVIVIETSSPHPQKKIIKIKKNSKKKSFKKTLTKKKEE
jgi:hypothetical protein